MSSRKQGKFVTINQYEILFLLRKQLYDYEWSEIHDIEQKVQEINLYQSQAAPSNSSIRIIGGGDSIRNELDANVILEVQGHKQTKNDEKAFDKYKQKNIQKGVKTKGFKFNKKPKAKPLSPEEQRTKDLELMAAKYNMGIQGPKITQHRRF